MARLGLLSYKTRMEGSRRYIDTGASLPWYAGKVQVRCAQCQAPGRVFARWEPYPRRGTYECVQCGLALNTDEEHWVCPVALVGRRPCGHCGHRWLTVREVFEEPPQANLFAVDVACPSCARVSRVEITAERSFQDHRSIDPHFGMPLLMTAKCRHGLFWAYSKRHLRELRAYTASKLWGSRAAGSSGVFYRLPRWMKLARNREEVLWRC